MAGANIGGGEWTLGPLVTAQYGGRVMQLAATEVLDLSKETEATKKLYGLDNPVTASYGTRCLMARRLVESGVRFVQVFVGKGQPWDHHAERLDTGPLVPGQND